MEKVVGIGGVFFRAKDPAALAKWYAQHLGVDKVPESDGQTPWFQESGETVFAPFPDDTDYFGDSSRQWMINFRVSNLKAMVNQLEAAGIHIEVDPETYPNGKFARLYDPEGTPVELWEPKA